MKVGIVLSFDSMHSLTGHPKCGKEHGHTYRVEVTLEGPVKNGMVMDFDVLKGKVKNVVQEFDHTNLNTLVPYSSCENLCLELHRRLREILPGPITIKIWEGDGKWAEHSA